MLATFALIVRIISALAVLICACNLSNCLSINSSQNSKKSKNTNSKSNLVDGVYSINSNTPAVIEQQSLPLYLTNKEAFNRNNVLIRTNIHIMIVFTIIICVTIPFTKANRVILTNNAIIDLGSPKTIILDDRDKIIKARKMYEALPDDAKSRVTGYNNLIKSENRLEALEIEYNKIHH